MPPYQVTLAFTEFAAGETGAARQTVSRALAGYRTIAAILAPVLEIPRYPEAAAAFREWRR